MGVLDDRRRHARNCGRIDRVLPRKRLALATTAALVALSGCDNARRNAHALVSHGCARTPSPQYVRTIRDVLASRRDVLGERLLAAPTGPTYDAAARLLPPLFYARGPGGRLETETGVYYLPFALPWSPGGRRGFALHLADGSQIFTRKLGRASMRIFVGAGGRERYGSCLGRLSPARLAHGWQPILETAYRDAAGVDYRQESFVGRMPPTHGLISFVHVHADASHAHAAATLRFVPSNARAYAKTIRRGSHADVYIARVNDDGHIVPVYASLYRSAQPPTIKYWTDALSRAARFVVPERRIMDAERALLIQELEMTWRYSVGNNYEELSFAEALDVAQTIGGYGYGDVARQILRFGLRRVSESDQFTNWRAGEELLASATYYALHRDRAYVVEETPQLSGVLARLEAAIASTRSGLLPRERYSSDIASNIVSLHGQTLAWQGLLAMSRTWRATGYVELADRSVRLALRLERALRSAVRTSLRRLPDGSVFVPARLLGGGEPFDSITDTREGTYWNLVTPYALASGFFDPHGSVAKGVLRYIRLHGGLMLGNVRAGGRRLSAHGTGRIAGLDQVYGVNLSRFLADADEPDQLVLSLYGTLAASMTPNTYVTGEAVSVQPIGNELYRTMHLPPNNDGTAAFLETLRVMLVHETRDARGAPRGLDLAFATPRPWLADGKEIAVTRAPTSFGAVGFRIRRDGRTFHVTVDAPSSPPPSLRLRLRFPEGTRTLDLSGRSGTFRVDVSLG